MRLELCRETLIIPPKAASQLTTLIADVRKVEHAISMRLTIILAALLLFGCSPSGTFNGDKWKNADLSTRERVEMVGPLLDQHPLKGLSRTEVIELLGEPTSTDKWKNWDMIYVLGPTEYMPIDHEWLVIRLDEEGRVTDYDVTAD